MSRFYLFIFKFSRQVSLCFSKTIHIFFTWQIEFPGFIVISWLLSYMKAKFNLLPLFSLQNLQGISLLCEGKMFFSILYLVVEVYCFYFSSICKQTCLSFAKARCLGMYSLLDIWSSCIVLGSRLYIRHELMICITSSICNKTRSLSKHVGEVSSGRVFVTWRSVFVPRFIFLIYDFPIDVSLLFIYF